MEIVNVDQLTPEWFEIRAKRLTASHAQAIGSAGKGLNTYVLQKMSEFYSKGEKEYYSNKDTERGNRLEPSAAFLYSVKQEIDVEKIGFVIHNDYIGASPDLFAGPDGLAEIKCPNDKTFFNLMLDFYIDSKYDWQMQMQMLVCKKNYCDYVCYNPNFKNNLLIKRVLPNKAKQDKLLKGFLLGENLIKSIAAKMDILEK